MTPITITKANFEEVVLHSDKPVLVDFWAPWCGYCRRISPVLDQIAQQRGVPVAQATINWTTQCGIVDTSLTGVRSAAEAEENTAAMAWSLTEDEVARINQAIDTCLA